MTDEAIIAELNAAFLRASTADEPINRRLGIYADALRHQLPAFAEAVDRLVARLHHSGAGEAAPKVGELMPPFLLPDDQGRLVSLEEVLSEGPVALAFHRGHWCPYCMLNSRALAKASEQAVAFGGQIIGITPEQQRHTRQQKDEASAEFKILSDLDNGYALSLNLAIWVGAELQQSMSEFGCDLARYQGNASWFLPIPATFIVAPDGIIRARFVDPDYRRRMHIEDLMAALRAAS
jgi:peroxiredoxin